MLLNLGIILIVAALLAVIASRFYLPSIVSFMGAGLLLGPVLGWVGADATIEFLGEMGIALLLFIVGLELSFERIRDVGVVAVVAGLGQIIFTAVGGFGLSLLLGFAPGAAAFLALALTFSSTVVVVKLLGQKDELNILYGRIAVGIFLVQDLVVVIALTFLVGMGGDQTVDAEGTALRMLGAFGGMALLLGIALVSSRFVLPRIFGWAEGNREMTFIWGLTWCFLFVVGAEVMNLSLELGAFIAGISLAQLPYNDDLRRRAYPLMSFFLAVFFVTLGLQMDLSAALSLWREAAILSLFVLLGKTILFMWIITRMGYSRPTAFLTSVTVAQISEFSFILAALGLQVGLIDADTLSLIAVVGLVTIAGSSLMILYNRQLYRALEHSIVLRIFGGSTVPEEEEETHRKGHVVVVGMNRMGRLVVEELIKRGEQVLAIDTDLRKLQGLPCETLVGSAEYESVLAEAGLDDARLLVSTLQIEETNTLLAYQCGRRGIPAAIHGFNRSSEEELEEMGVAYLIRSRASGLRGMIDALRRIGVAAP